MARNSLFTAHDEISLQSYGEESVTFSNRLHEASTAESVAVSKWHVESTRDMIRGYTTRWTGFFFPLKLSQNCLQLSTQFLWEIQQMQLKILYLNIQTGKIQRAGNVLVLQYCWYLTTVRISCKSEAQWLINCYKLRAAIKLQISASMNSANTSASENALWLRNAKKRRVKI